MLIDINRTQKDIKKEFMKGLREMLKTHDIFSVNLSRSKDVVNIKDGIIEYGPSNDFCVTIGFQKKPW